jgi:hypothetical protein
MMQPSPDEKKAQRTSKDPNLLLAFRLPDLEKVLPWSGRTLMEWESLGLFPKGGMPHAEAQKVWTRKLLQAYLDMLGSEGMEQLPAIAEKIKSARG